MIYFKFVFFKKVFVCFGPLGSIMITKKKSVEDFWRFCMSFFLQLNETITNVDDNPWNVEGIRGG